MKPPNMAPLYATIWEAMTKVARAHGYCLAIHGTLNRDLDLLAVPWTEEAVSAEELAAAFAKELAWAFDDGTWHMTAAIQKPHGRLAWSIPWMKDWQVDLSVMPRTRKED